MIQYSELVDELCVRSRLEFYEPEQIVVRQMQRDTKHMYFIVNGDFKVHVVDTLVTLTKMEDNIVSVLSESNYFGEVALIHDGYRTASVTSLKYGTLGAIDLSTLYQLTQKFNGLRNALLSQVMMYKDGVRLFLMEALRKISYLKDGSERLLSSIAYSMKPEWLESGTKLFADGDLSKCLFVIHFGCVEIQTNVDNSLNFCIEKLQRGSVINP
jgi:CRP-like cAMP-binding protein